MLCTSALAAPAAPLSGSVKMLVVLMAPDDPPETKKPFIKCTYALSREGITNEGPAPPALHQEFLHFSLSPLSKANTQILNNNKINKPMPQINHVLKCFPDWIWTVAPRPTGHLLPLPSREPGSAEQVPLLIATALFLLGKHCQNPAQEYHLAFLQHVTNTNQWAQHHQIQ